MEPRVIGLNIEGPDTIYTEAKTQIRIFGNNLTNLTMLVFTPSAENCDDKTDPIQLVDTIGDSMAMISVRIPEAYNYICLKSDSTWYHQGSESWVSVQSRGKLMPLYIHIMLIIFLLLLSGLFAGLNLGLMSLDCAELHLVARSGTDVEKMYAKRIQPIRSRGHFLLCTILLSNVMLNTTLTVLLGQLTSSLMAVITATLSIVIIADIIPQAICARHGLVIGARTIYITYLFMFLTFPLSYPISKVLDWILGESP